MALSDYYLCDECGAKTFCDASLSYDDSNADPDTMHPWPDNVGWMRVLCHGCAEAARSESEDTQRSEASQPVLPDELVEAVRDHVSPKTSYYPDTWKRLVAALASLPDPLHTVESVRADERERLAKLADSAEWTELEVRQSSDNHFVTTLQDWLRSQKGEG